MTTLALQKQLADSIRNAGVAAPEGVSERALGVYRDLFFNNVLSFLDGTFPVCERVLSHLHGREQWLQLAREFLRDYHCTSPLFLDIPQHFLDYLSQRDDVWLPPWLCELAHYEWLELAVDIAPQTITEDVDANADLATSVPILAAAAQGYLYQYPVHTISVDEPDPTPTLTALIVFRDRQDKTCFIESNPLTLGLLAQLQEQSCSGSEAVAKVLAASGQALSDSALAGGLAILQQWQQQGLILGASVTARSS
ncbi:DUF2063 domain-containing protein [Bacterioplanes sanyensis]|uniref:DUF2063 domain-containing protein n=1 Tax=Bacterioplanes sanyensis TaxID=1249553 RepID=A0A222FLQ8_9GAMM|nr:putative DNA-binding domain-containing protein [Bacterioplanes sanyensis]ASP39710.1 DUF2063 domain-containing protein [Bacterioplanes sanyensis]